MNLDEMVDPRPDFEKEIMKTRADQTRNALVQVAKKLRAVALHIDGTATEKSLISIAKELERIIGVPSAEPLKLKQRLFQLSVSRTAFARVNVYATNVEDAREKALVEAMMLTDAGWTLDSEIKIDGLINATGDLQRLP